MSVLSVTGSSTSKKKIFMIRNTINWMGTFSVLITVNSYQPIKPKWFITWRNRGTTTTPSLTALCVLMLNLLRYNSLRKHLSNSRKVIKQGGECLVCEQIFLRSEHCTHHMTKEHGMRKWHCLSCNKIY